MSDPPHTRLASVEDAAAIAEFGARTFNDAFAGDNHPADMAAYVDQAFAPDSPARGPDHNPWPALGRGGL